MGIANRIKGYLKKEYKEMLKALIVSMLITIIFILYLHFIGLPLSNSHNLYIKGHREYINGRDNEAIKYLEESLLVWDNKEAKLLLEEISNQ